MANFPTTEDKIIALAKSIKAGLADNAGVYPAPPASSVVLGSALDTLQTLIDQTTAAKAAVTAATMEKANMLQTIVTLMKKDLAYAETTVGNDDAKLELLGWGARKDPAPTTLPGQTRRLSVTSQGDGTLTLVWIAPAEGGKANTYIVQRRLKSELNWIEIASTYQKTIALAQQSRGVELEYSVVAANKAGNGLASNSVVVVL